MLKLGGYKDTWHEDTDTRITILSSLDYYIDHPPLSSLNSYTRTTKDMTTKDRTTNNQGQGQPTTKDNRAPVAEKKKVAPAKNALS